MKKLKTICFIPLYGPIICFFYLNQALKKKGLVSNKITIAYLVAMMFMGSIAMILFMLICSFFEIDFEYDLRRFIIVGVLVWIFLLVPVMHFLKKYGTYL